ncbi:atos homolog protein A [Bombina bombina]|uniref:atos homolog protein A n=1 Tax=Bombina bombina TaxID=8345 RepID=UPI00235A58A5|nr:atos homolog protein A [Bombina bombina]
MKSSCEADGRMKPDRDSMDEFFEYEAEEFLVYLALLITEGRTPEHSVKGRTEGLHCPPAQSSQPGPTKHECSEKLAQCRQARRTRSEVALLWRNNIPIMVEVMLLPDCCYSDEGGSTEGNDLNDPAMKQDALLLERWILEPVPRQSGDRFIEEKTLLLAIRSFVFFSQLSAWLSVSHGAVPRNILYRVSAADGELQWNFSHTPTEHVFPVPNVSHSVALKVSVQSLPRQSSYPVLNCSIHSNLGFLDKKMSTCEHSVSPTLDAHRATGHGNILSSTQASNKQLWTVGREGLLHTRASSNMNTTASVRSAKFLSSSGNSYGIGTSPSKLQCFNVINDSKAAPHNSPIRNLKSFSLVDLSSSTQQNQSTDTNPLIGTLIQERQEVIARIAHHLLQCDQANSHISSNAFNMLETSPVNSKIFRSPHEEDNATKRNQETPVTFTSTLGFTVTTDSRKNLPDTPISSSRPNSEDKTSPKLQARRKLILDDEPVFSTFQQSLGKTTQSALLWSSKENIFNPPENVDILISEQTENNVCKGTGNHCTYPKNSSDRICTNKQNNPDEKHSSHSLNLDNSKHCSKKVVTVCQTQQLKDVEKNLKKAQCSDHNKQLHSIENYRDSDKDRDSVKARETQEKQKTLHDENEDPAKCDCHIQGQRKCNGSCLTRCERLKNTNQLKTIQLKQSTNWKKQSFRSLDGILTNVFHPSTGLPLLSSPVPQRKTQSGYFDLDTSLLKIKGLYTKRRLCVGIEGNNETIEKQFSCSAPPAPCLGLLGNFEESVLNYRLEPLGIVEGFTAEVGASGIFCPTHMTLPVKVSFYSVSDDNAPSPYMGNITLESLGKRGYRIPPSGTIQVTLFNPNKTVVKMFVVKYDLREMPANHQTFLRQRTFSVPVKRDRKGAVIENILQTEDRTLRYLIHLRFQSSKSSKIYLHTDVRLLFSRKSMEVDSGAAYELKSYIETPTNPQYSPRC